MVGRLVHWSTCIAADASQYDAFHRSGANWSGKTHRFASTASGIAACLSVATLPCRISHSRSRPCMPDLIHTSRNSRCQKGIHAPSRPAQCCMRRPVWAQEVPSFCNAVVCRILHAPDCIRFPPAQHPLCHSAQALIAASGCWAAGVRMLPPPSTRAARPLPQHAHDVDHPMWLAGPGDQQGARPQVPALPQRRRLPRDAVHTHDGVPQLHRLPHGPPHAALPPPHARHPPAVHLARLRDRLWRRPSRPHLAGRLRPRRRCAPSHCNAEGTTTAVPQAPRLCAPCLQSGRRVVDWAALVQAWPRRPPAWSSR